jgi:hypothetical protein
MLKFSREKKTKEILFEGKCSKISYFCKMKKEHLARFLPLGLNV